MASPVRAAGCLALLALALLGPGCERATRAPLGAPEGVPEVAWPAAPARPRVRFVRSVTGPADLGIRPSVWERLGRLVAGGEDRRFVRPTGVAARGETLYVADPGTPALWILDTRGGRVERVARAGGEELRSPVAVTPGPGGGVYLADSARARVFRLDAGGAVTATLADARFRRPAGLAYDAARDRLYVADSAAHQVWILAGDGRPLGAIGGRGTAPGEFNFPTHLALASDGTLAVTDALAYRIQLFGPDGAPAGHFGRHGDGPGDFAAPKGVGLDRDGHVYVVEALFDAVQIFDRAGRYLLTFGERGAGRGQLWLPGGLAIDEQNRIYVSDAYNARIQVFEYVPEAERG